MKLSRTVQLSALALGIALTAAAFVTATPSQAQERCTYHVGMDGHGDSVECDPGSGGGPAPLKWVAFAVSQANHEAGMSWDYDSAADAADEAREQCATRGSHCVVVMTATLCSALARSADNRGVGWGSDYTLAAARRRALSSCAASGDGACHVDLARCP
jgi:hypothetical protein